MPEPFIVRRAAVLGAGVMGAQIAAHLVNAGIPVLLYDLPADGGAKSATAARAIDGLRALQPAPLALPGLAAHLTPCNYDEDLPRLAGCDLVIEAIAERLDLKLALYARVAPHLGDRAVFVTNTSGLSPARLADGLPAALAQRFCGVHFFNPPRYMALVELVPAPATEPELLDALETFLVTRLGKSVIRAKDTPNFIGNRVGVFALLAVMHHAERLALGFDVVDALTGPLIGRPRSATFRTADVVGLDTFAHVVKTLRDGLPDDPWHPHFVLPAWMEGLIADGALGQKSRRGVYRKQGEAIAVYDPPSGAYRPATGVVSPEVADILKDADVARRFARLRTSGHPQAQFLWSAYRDTFHYCAFHLAAIADTARDVDCALRWGFAWGEGVFETWQAAGWSAIASAIADDVAAGRAMSAAPLPAWAADPARTAVHTAAGSLAPAEQTYRAPSTLPVYRRQHRPQLPFDPVASPGVTLFETPAVRCWQAPGHDAAVVSFRTKRNTIDEGVLDGLLEALDRAQRNAAGLVIAQTEPPFSAGANLRRERGAANTLPQWLNTLRHKAQSLVLDVARRLGLADALMAGRLGDIERLVAHFQTTHQTLRYAPVPVVAAVDGMALGGGCELLMHCDCVVAAFESYPGLVEAGVGLIPAGGGCKELALRAADSAGSGDVFPAIRKAFETIALGTVARSAVEARELGFLQRGDPVVMNRHEILHVALSEVRALREAGYRPPLPPPSIRVAGRDGAATLRAHVANLRAGERISDHDVRVATALAHVLCGGDVEAGASVDEAWMLRLEREQFMALIATAETQARIAHTLKTGKPLRN